MASRTDSALRGLRDRLAAMAAPPFRARAVQLCAAAAMKLVADEFRGSHAPDGTTWKALVSRKGKPLLDTGRLRASFSVSPLVDAFRIGTAVAYAGYQQFGTAARDVAARVARQNARGRFISGKARKASGKNFEGTVTRGGYLVRLRAHRNGGIPARPMLPGASLPPTWREAFDREISRALRAQIRGTA